MYRQIINNNDHRFKVGSVMRRRTFARLFKVKKIVHEGTFAEVQRSNLTLVGVQAEVNNILRSSGLVLKSRDYYSEFYICSLAQTGNTVLSYQGKSEAHKQCSDGLESAVIQRIKAGTWGTYTPTIPRVTTSPSKPSATYARKQKRVKHWK